MKTYTYDVLLGVMYSAGNNCADNAIGRMMDDVEAECWRWPHWDDIAPSWIVKECGLKPNMLNELMDEAIELRKLRGKSGDLMEATPEQIKRFNSFMEKIDRAFAEMELTSHEYNSIAGTAFYDFEPKHEAWMDW